MDSETARAIDDTRAMFIRDAERVERELHLRIIQLTKQRNLALSVVHAAGKFLSNRLPRDRLAESLNRYNTEIILLS